MIVNSERSRLSFLLIFVALLFPYGTLVALATEADRPLYHPVNVFFPQILGTASFSDYEPFFSLLSVLQKRVEDPFFPKRFFPGTVMFWSAGMYYWKRCPLSSVPRSSQEE